MNTISKQSRIRRLTAGLTVAGALTAIPVALIAIPASAATPDDPAAIAPISAPDWNNGHGGRPHDGDHHRRDGDRRDGGPRNDNPLPGPGVLPSTGSFGG
ncbi:hypothetical protein LTV02_31275 [Nocardia yamanashiensis]|uniref:hypothetical protein n=1 Tax=Nocardia yamanashiensis TaxID=209247 RepID=UPI001E4C9CF5|nr:hypothetical protein [Nocardia yamanashiensis]UGT40452.1 hypothetical protein LTV02_31275 [Nocardia yamanashiensis]